MTTAAGTVTRIMKVREGGDAGSNLRRSHSFCHTVISMAGQLLAGGNKVKLISQI